MINKFKSAMLDNGIEPPSWVIADGILHRFKINGKSSGWYVLFSGDYWAGSFGDWSKDIKIKWRQDSDVKQVFTDEMRQKIESDKILRKQRFDDGRRKAATNAWHCWNNSLQTGVHPYAIKKGIVPFGARVFFDLLIVPIYNFTGGLVNIQTINKRGEKLFLTGGEKKGCFFEIPGDTEIILICEGYATGCSLREQFGCHVVVAFDAGNLEPVAVNIKKLYPDSDIIIAADNDASGVGEKKAREAAQAIGASYIMPEIVGMDFNDVYNVT